MIFRHFCTHILAEIEIRFTYSPIHVYSFPIIQTPGWRTGAPYIYLRSRSALPPVSFLHSSPTGAASIHSSSLFCHCIDFSPWREQMRWLPQNWSGSCSASSCEYALTCSPPTRDAPPSLLTITANSMFGEWWITIGDAFTGGQECMRSGECQDHSFKSVRFYDRLDMLIGQGQ